MKSKRVILDTNLWISFLISEKLNQIDNLILEKKITLIFSEELIQEFISVARRPKFKNYISENQIINLLEIINDFSEIIRVSADLRLCRDLKDNFILNLAVDGKANYLITGDEDLLILKKVNTTRIVTWNEFLKSIKNK